MAKKRPKKPLSPYDPRSKDNMDKYPSNLGGKMEPDREPRRFNIAGCGDPACQQCNPESAEAIRRGELDPRQAETMRQRPGTVLPNRDFERMREAFVSMAKKAGNAEGNTTWISFDESPRPQAGPPASYKEAREKVESLILSVPPKTDWSDVIGNEHAAEKLREAVEAPIKEKELYEHYGMQPPRGALLYGPPGCGKTMFAKAAAATVAELYGKECELLSLHGSTVQSPWVGVTEQKIREIFAYAREYRAYHGFSLVVFIDEAEVLLPDRTGRTRRVSPWEESQVATFLAEMDGMEECGAFVLLATNRPEAIDEALLRDGRCDYKIKVERPTRKAVEYIVRLNLKGIPTKEDLDTLAFTAAECLYDPNYVIKHAGALAVNINNPKEQVEMGDNMCLEHIVSGAIAAGIPRRAKSIAFNRDRKAGTRTGITTSDIIDAVREVYNENKDLEHSFATQEFMASFREKFEAKIESKGHTKQ